MTNKTLIELQHSYAWEERDMRNALALNSFAEEVHTQAKDRGWHDEPKPFPTLIALCHTELSEALEAWRCRKMDDHLPQFNGEAVELADEIIRCFDAAVAMGHTNIGEIIVAKHLYNRRRKDHSREERAKEGGKRI